MAGLRPWSAPSWMSVLTRVFVAVSVLSVELQLATWLGVGSIRTLVIVNLVVAVVAFFAWRPDGRTAPRPAQSEHAAGSWPWIGVLTLGALVVLLNLGMPLTAADPYHLDKLSRIEATGTLAYDLDADLKLNILSSVYEMVLADLRQIPLIGQAVVRLHGILGLLLYLLALGAVRELLQTRFDWRWSILLVVPVVFHQLVLVKNDMFVGALALVVVAWVVTRSATADRAEIVWASWLAALAVSIKLTSLPLAVILVGALVIQRRQTWRPMLASAAIGGLLGIVAGGLLFTLVENARVYGNLMPASDIGGRYDGVGAVVVGLVRFGISLFDLGSLTPVFWPGRGSWGSTFGLPFVWALVVLTLAWRRSPEARRALVCAGLHFFMYAAVFPDADAAQRLVLGSGLLLICVALQVIATDPKLPRLASLAILPVLALSAAQIARSAVLYWVRA